MEKESIHNPQLKLANDFVQFTGKNIFLTGKAGTGKTTFLHKLKEQSPKRMIVVAPTGVAAINAGGVTIHSFFQLPFGPNVPGYSGNEHQSFRRFSREKRNIMKSLDLLVIDEISMVRSDLLDGVDETLRRFRNNNMPFGGVQLLMIGDMQQLAPVIKDAEWYMLRKYYDSAFFFSSKALCKTDFISIELFHVYRQSDQYFISLLNKIRDNKVDDELIAQLNKRYKPNFDPEDENYIILTTHNAKAKQVNDSRLGKIKEKSFFYHADINGSFPEYTYPTETELELKKGAQVMFVKNDPDAEKRYFNGKIGVITKLDKDGLVVQCPGDKEPIDVLPIEWQNMKYAIDEGTKEIKETIEGTFTQIPLKLAWAITIHKSQGLTFDKAIIDSQAAFAYGQVYVAMSRCRTLEGLVLSSPFSPSTLKHDKTIEGFNSSVENNQPDEHVLDDSRQAYQEELLLDLFDFTQIQKGMYRFQKALNENRNSIQPKSLAEDIWGKIGLLKSGVLDVSLKFKKQISQYLKQNSNAEQNVELQERIKKAVSYFSDKIQEHILNVLETSTVETDNKEVRKVIGKAEDALKDITEYKFECLKACQNGFVVKNYLVERAKASLEKPQKKRPGRKRKPSVSSEIHNTNLYDVLKKWRNAKSAELNVPFFMVLPLKTMRALSNQVPANSDELKLVHGFGKKKMEQFGDELLELLKAYRDDHEVVIVENEEKKRPESAPKKNTKQISFELWLEHKDIAKVAIEREMANTTIEGHLAYFVGKGELSVFDFISKDKINRITNFFERNGDMLLSEAKAKLGDEISYRELKFVQQHLIFARSVSS